MFLWIPGTFEQVKGCSIARANHVSVTVAASNFMEVKHCTDDLAADHELERKNDRLTVYTAVPKHASFGVRLCGIPCITA